MSNNVLYYFTNETINSQPEIKEEFNQNSDLSFIAIAFNIPSASSVLDEFCQHQNQLKEVSTNFGQHLLPSSPLPYAFFVGLKFPNNSNKSWEVLIWGNIYLFHYQHRSQTTNIFSSAHPSNIVYFQGQCEKKDLFLLLDHELGKWLCNQIHTKTNQTPKIFKIKSQKQLNNFMKHSLQKQQNLSIVKPLIIGFSLLIFVGGIFGGYFAFQEFQKQRSEEQQNIFRIN